MSKASMVDWSQSELRLPAHKIIESTARAKRFPAVVHYMDGSFKLGYVVAPSLDYWLALNPDVFRVEVQLGTREALPFEVTDLF